MESTNAIRLNQIIWRSLIVEIGNRRECGNGIDIDYFNALVKEAEKTRGHLLCPVFAKLRFI